jgi:hypothetical protein
MKKISSNLTFIMLITLLPVIILSSCESDILENPDLDPRDKFLGTWLVSESCVRLDYQATIKADPDDENKVLIENFAAPGNGFPPAYGFVDGNVINMPQQNIGDNWRVEGTGSYREDNTIFWSYFIEIGANASNCEADYR